MYNSKNKLIVSVEKDSESVKKLNEAVYYLLSTNYRMKHVKFAS